MVNDVTYHLPDLHDVVFRHRANNPRFILVPGKVGDLGRVTAMNKLRTHTHTPWSQCALQHTARKLSALLPLA